MHCVVNCDNPRSVIASTVSMGISLSKSPFSLIVILLFPFPITQPFSQIYITLNAIPPHMFDFRPLSGLFISLPTSTRQKVRIRNGFRPLSGLFISLQYEDDPILIPGRFPSPFGVIHLTTTMVVIMQQKTTSFRPLSGLFISLPVDYDQVKTLLSFRPLSGLFISLPM